MIVNTSTEIHSTRLGLDSEIVYKSPLVELSDDGELTMSAVGAVVYLRG